MATGVTTFKRGSPRKDADSISRDVDFLISQLNSTNVTENVLISVADDELLSYNGTKGYWINRTAAEAGLLYPVSITAAASGDYIRHNGTNFVDVTIAQIITDLALDDIVGGSGIDVTNGVDTIIGGNATLALGALSGDWDAGSHKITAEQIAADIGDGTAPLIVASTTVVANLQAATAAQWHTTRTITMTGDVSADSVNIDGTGNIDITTTAVANDSHSHDGSYYTETELNAGQLDNRYYTETELNTALALKAPLASPTFTGAVTIPSTADDATYTGIVTNDSGVLKYRTTAEVLSDIAASPLAGSASITTVGTIGTGVWQGTAIDSAYIDQSLSVDTLVLGSNTDVGAVSLTAAAFIGDTGPNIFTGQLQAPNTGSGAGLLMGGDFQIYRSQANVGYTPDGFTVIGVLRAEDSIILKGKAAFTTAYDAIEGLLMNSSNVTPGLNEYGVGIEFSRLGNASIKKSAIVPKQLGADSDQMGLAFLVSQGATSTDPLIEGMVLGVGGQAQFPVTGSGAGLLIGGDFQIYRSAANIGYTPDGFTVAGVLHGGGAADYTEVEADGDINFVGGGGMQFGEIYYHGAGFDTALAAQDTDYQIVGFDTDGETNGVAVPNHSNDHITTGVAGRYRVSLSISSRSATANNYDFHVARNNNDSEFANATIHRTTSVASRLGHGSTSAIIDCAANDTIEVWVHRTDGGGASKTITIESITLNVMQIGGT